MIRVTPFLIALLLLLAIAACTPAGDSDDEAGTDDLAQIYAAAIHEIYHVDHSFGSGGSPGWPLVYVVATTNDAAMVDAPTAPSQAISTDLQEAITTELADEPFQLIWIEEFEDAPIDQTNGQIAEGEGIIITLGNTHPQNDDSVQLPFFMTCGGLCGIGKTYVLDQISGNWQVSGSVGPEIMS
jgi:hypothetical protein